MASIGLVRRIAMKRQQFRNNNRVIRAAVRDCEWLKMSLQLNRFAAMRLRLPPKQAMVRHLQTTKQEALFRALAGGARPGCGSGSAPSRRTRVRPRADSDSCRGAETAEAAMARTASHRRRPQRGDFCGGASAPP